MNRPRCQYSDAEFRASFPFRKHDLKWYFPRNTPAAQKDAEMAFQMWQNVSNLTFTMVTNPTLYPPDITITMVSKTHYFSANCMGNDECPLTLDDAGGVLGHAYFPDSSGTCREIHLDINECWYFGNNPNIPKNQTSFLMVLVHEIGHALGIAHSASPNAIMFAFYQHEIRGLDVDDINAVQYLYGRKNKYDSIPKSTTASAIPKTTTTIRSTTRKQPILKNFGIEVSTGRLETPSINRGTASSTHRGGLKDSKMKRQQNNTEVALKKELVYTAKSVRKKFIAIKKGREFHDSALQQVYEPITKQLKTIAVASTFSLSKQSTPQIDSPSILKKVSFDESRKKLFDATKSAVRRTELLKNSSEFNDHTFEQIFPPTTSTPRLQSSMESNNSGNVSSDDLTHTKLSTIAPMQTQSDTHSSFGADEENLMSRYMSTSNHSEASGSLTNLVNNHISNLKANNPGYGGIHNVRINPQSDKLLLGKLQVSFDVGGRCLLLDSEKKKERIKFGRHGSKYHTVRGISDFGFKLTTNGDYDIGKKLIKNVGDLVDKNDAVTVKYIEETVNKFVTEMGKLMRLAVSDVLSDSVTYCNDKVLENYVYSDTWFYVSLLVSMHTRG
ncbi:unnamed protein product [Acanthoscelides obtectus]|uniref:Peptidase metallopeptidase domain-containing protein n=1 Tax=Acanthoscelides obtectus TaxID=200917 RepID=A0A9P0LLR5_ACAOB|nr:unnamed protein product [Acanthoscelides obtectus]CAK1658169.1 Matrix metalloproteinase-28 [Acanthoscelides obtectus]